MDGRSPRPCSSLRQTPARPGRLARTATPGMEPCKGICYDPPNTDSECWSLTSTTPWRLQPEKTVSNLYTQILIAIFIALSLVPVLTFATFALAVMVFAVGFTVFWIAVGLLLLVPALIFCAGVALSIWVGGIASLVAARFVYEQLGGTAHLARDSSVFSEKDGDKTPKASGIGSGTAAAATGTGGGGSLDGARTPSPMPRLDGKEAAVGSGKNGGGYVDGMREQQQESPEKAA